MNLMSIRSLSTCALLAFVLAPLAACAAPDEAEEAVGSSASPLTIARPGDLKPGIGASACKTDTCISGQSNDCSDFDDACKAEAGCGVTTGGNPIAQVHTCVAIPSPPSSSDARRPGTLTTKDAPQEEECFDGDACNDLIAACIGGDHIWVCHTYGDEGRCVHGDCVGAP